MPLAKIKLSNDAYVISETNVIHMLGSTVTPTLPSSEHDNTSLMPFISSRVLAFEHGYVSKECPDSRSQSQMGPDSKLQIARWFDMKAEEWMADLSSTVHVRLSI